MSAAHTPAPWAVGRDYGLNRTEISAPNGNCIATVFTKEERARDEFVPFHEGIANARLIAAAPELLEVLEDAVALADRNASSDPDWEGRTPEYQASYDRVRAAIAKARGQ